MIWVLIETRHHLNQAICLAEMKPETKFIFIYTKPSNDSNVSKKLENVKNYLPNEHIGKGFFIAKYKSHGCIEFLSKFQKPEELVTFYDTHYLFLIIKSYFKIPWSKVALIDDGMANTIKLSMPSFLNRLIKFVINYFLRGFEIPMSRYSLGNNKKILKAYTIFPLNYSSHEKLNKVDLSYDFYESALCTKKNKTDFRGFKGQIILIPPLISVRGKGFNELKIFLGKLIKAVDKENKVFIKTHPREGKITQEYVVDFFSKNFFKSELLPNNNSIEFYFEEFSSFSVIGPPSTSLLIATNYYKDKLIKPIICVEDKTNPYSRQHMQSIANINSIKIFK